MYIRKIMTLCCHSSSLFLAHVMPSEGASETAGRVRILISFSLWKCVVTAHLDMVLADHMADQVA